MTQKKELKKYSKFMLYVLGRHPDEFGLVPDPDGFVKIKEFIKAVTEEDGWKFFRKSNIDEILLSDPNPPVEIKGGMIRACIRDHLPGRIAAEAVPKLLYSAIRRKAYPATLEKGIRPMGRRHVILAASIDLAQRIGRRIDNHPIILTVQTPAAMQHGCLLLQAGEGLYLSRFIATECFSGPPLPKEPREPLKKEPAKAEDRNATPGSFFPEMPGTGPEKKPGEKQRRRKEIGWKIDRKRMRRR